MSQIFKYNKTFQLESGRTLPDLQLGFTTLGKLNVEKDNVIWITHALTANSNPSEWWGGLVGKGKLYNPDQHFIVCVNVLGSPYGSSNPLSINPQSGNKYYHNFPEITIRDIVNTFELLRKHLGITKINTLLGGSLGGQQAVEWAIQQPKVIENLFLIATNAQHSPWGIAFNESQRLAIKADPTWVLYSDDAGLNGLIAARAVALLSYRNYLTYQITQEDLEEKTDDFNASSYQNYQGKKLINRFNAYSYWHLSKAMDSHNVGRNRGGIARALNLIKAKTLIVAIGSDLLFPVSESETLHENIKNSSFEIIESLYGHDGFLIETDQLKNVFDNFYISQNLKKNMSLQNKHTALIGFGTVGQGFYHYLFENNEHKKLASVVIKTATKIRITDTLMFTTNLQDVFQNNEIKTVVELINDDQEAFNIVKQTLKQGKNVVSANKKMIAHHLEELVGLEKQFGGKFLYEGAVAGSIPIIKIINEHYEFDKITEMRGILNGTSNYILTQVFEREISYSSALKQAQDAGFAEVNPSSDVEGHDALYKLIILTAHAFGKFVLPKKVLTLGISNIKTSDVDFAKKHNLAIKLVGTIKNVKNILTLNVLPTLVDKNDDLYFVKNEYNAIEIVSKNLGTQLYVGKGAGRLPTGHVVYSDFKGIECTKYSYQHTQSGKRIKYETNDHIWIYSNRITFLEKYLIQVIIINGPEGYGKISISDLIKVREQLLSSKISIIALNESIIKKLTLNVKKFDLVECV